LLPYRIGIGYDVHAFAENRKLIIGGIEIPFEKGLAGHSDADVLLHAIADALLGALSLGDIGQHFPDTDEKFRGADSKLLLDKAHDMIKSHGYILGNVDAVVALQRPKLAPYIPQMKESIAKLFNVLPECVSIKATTTERLGFVGREEGIEATAIVLVTKESV
jgi:2-C-methyl-D-erythritol 2,4-cyclodiphosphate synthase